MWRQVVASGAHGRCCYEDAAAGQQTPHQFDAGVQGTVEDDLVSMLRAEAAAAPSGAEVTADAQPAAVAAAEAAESLATGGCAAHAEDAPPTVTEGGGKNAPAQQAAGRANCLLQYWYAAPSLLLSRRLHYPCYAVYVLNDAAAQQYC
jgi:hypothetical protein